jgi:hypothetical protein
MKRGSVNFVVDFISLVLLTALIVTGWIIRFILPPGTGGSGRLLHDGAGREHIRTLFSMSRHQWGDVHFYLAVAFIVSMIVHVVLHWDWIKSRVKFLFLFSSKD